MASLFTSPVSLTNTVLQNSTSSTLHEYVGDTCAPQSQIHLPTSYTVYRALIGMQPRLTHYNSYIRIGSMSRDKLSLMGDRTLIL